MGLALDYRPRNLKELAGNEALKKSIAAILKRPIKAIPHVWMFTGISGGGKTTLARIIASHLKCDKNEFYEMNAASIRGIDNIRDIEDKIRYKAMKGSVRIWLLDEIHQYRTDTQEAMLKMLEECPDHVYFILCTTDPQKLKPTLKNRCTTFEVKALSNEEMIELLDSIVEEEGKGVPEKVLKQIVDTAQGSPRAALQILERVIDLPEKDMLKAAEETAETETQVIDLCRALLNPKAKWPEISKIITNLQAEPETIRFAVLGYCNSVLLKGDNPRAWLIMDCFKETSYSLGKFYTTHVAYSVING